MRLVRRRSGQQPGWMLRVHFHLAKGRDQTISRRLAHSLFAGPVPQERSPELVIVEMRASRHLAGCQEAGTKLPGIERSITGFNVDADPDVVPRSLRDRDHRDTAGMRDIEVECGISQQL